MLFYYKFTKEKYMCQKKKINQLLSFPFGEIT